MTDSCVFGSFTESKCSLISKDSKKLRNYRQERFCGVVFLFNLIIAQKQIDKVSFSCPISVCFPSDIKHMVKAEAQRDCFNIITESQH